MLEKKEHQEDLAGISYLIVRKATNDKLFNLMYSLQ